MSRIATGDTVTVAPSSNIYTALAVAAVVAVAFGLLVIFWRGTTLGVKFI
ncbi:MAG TPA: hypothetical protein VH518_14710 [Tepidisphaeraceae bacterium]|jgi:hypothetical protein